MTRIFPFLATLAVAMFLALPAVAQPDAYSAPELQWRTITTKHFHVHYHEGAERSARVIARIAEDVYGPITTLYRHEPDERVSFIVKDYSDYANGAAYFFNNKIEIWASPLDFDLRGTHNWLRNVITHEFTHIIQIQAAMKFGRSIPALTFQWFGYEKERRRDVLYGYPNTLVSYPFPGVIVPPWFAEGTAQFQRGKLTYDAWDAHRDMILRCYVLADSMLSWGEMSAFGKTSLGNESVYNAGYNLTRYIAKTYGEDKLEAITRAMGKPLVFTIDAAIEDVLGISGRDLYAQWRQALREEYAQRIAPVSEHRVEGRRIADVGFGNFYPRYSPDGKTLAYTSNKAADYFGQSSLFLYDLASGTEKALLPGVRSTLSWSPDGKTIVFSKYNPPSVQGHLYYDLYKVDVATGEEKQLTTGLRAYNPAWSPDGSSIAFVYSKDGTINLGLVQADGSGMRPVTAFTKGEQVMTPSWSPDGKWIIFAFAPRTHRGLARIRPDGSGLEYVLIDGEYDCRDPRYSSDGKHVLYASNRTGIFNIYRLKLADGTSEQLTNVLGGAFMPDLNADGTLAYALYTAGGYKIATLDAPQPLDAVGRDYLPPRQHSSPIASADESWDWNALNDFDDSDTSRYSSAPHSRLFQSMMYFPTFRIDSFNPDNEGLELFKPGLMMYSSDVLGRLDFMASASINIKGERDLYLNITYRDKLPLFSSLGLYPDLSLEVFNVTRGTTANIPLPLDTLGVDVDFNLLEFAVRLGHNIVDNSMRLELGYAHSRYTSTTGSFRNPDNEAIVPARDNLYLVGNNISAVFRYKDLVPTRDHEISPIGSRFTLHYDYEFNNYNPDGEYEIKGGLLLPVYRDFNFHRLDAQLSVGARLPWWNHALTLRARAATILGDPVDEFFNYYAGGITGMQGYTFYSLGGNELATAQLTYRFPIFSSMDLHLGHLLFDKLYGGIFVDVGDAVMAPEDFSTRALKRDVGFELRLESFSFSMYPTRIFFSGAYGLDSFTRTFQFTEVTYGKEWRWYFGMLFGFDLSDGF
ncbi:MAG TPA: biopolymer transporter Tol [Bacteroidota bacterium]|nr:biopolymer transporter Tol [Bacteroidota bacterium]